MNITPADEIRHKIARLIAERGLNYAQVSLAIGKNIAYIQQYIKNGSPRRLGELERQKLARMLRVNEQELTDIPLNLSATPGYLNSDILCLIIEKIESWLKDRNAELEPRDKADLIKLMYMKVCNETIDVAADKVKDFIEIYEELKKAK